jgi:tetratricopeptide (TPR) repeat protein
MTMMNPARPKMWMAVGAISLMIHLPMHPADAESASSPSRGRGRALDMAELQPLLSGGQSSEVLQRLTEALERDPNNARLLYNHGIAAYAAGQLEDSLVSFDRAEAAGGRRIAALARFQKGNAEFRLGDSARKSNLDETISRWKQSLENYRDALRENPDDKRSEENYRFVRRSLLDLLLKDAKRHQEKAKDPVNSTSQRVENLRNAFEKFSDAKNIDPDSREAAAGEQETREQLARELAREGKRLADQPLRPRFNPREPALPDFETKALEEGVGMLEDANRLLPEDAPIQKDLQEAKQKLAEADVQRAQRYMELEERTPWTREKLAVLRMARELTEKALDQVPNFKPAEETREEINRRLAQIHEDEADALSQQAQNMNLEQQAMALSQALDHFQQANDLQPNQPQLPPKIEKTEDRLANALEKLADRLMQTPKFQESLEQQIGRLEGADQALSELMGLKPSPESQQKSDQVGEQLAGLRQKAAEMGQQPGQQGQPMPMPGGQMGQLPFQMGPPMDQRPKINTPGVKGEWSSRAMNSGKDY